MDYRFTIGEDDKASGAYKAYLGGGSERWDDRGRAQLSFLRERGLSPSSTLLDVGCGPLRAGLHLIDYLDAGNYVGIDINASFIEIASSLIATHASGKRALARTLDGFALAELRRSFDFILAFSVLNHCSQAEQQLFFQNLPAVMTASTRVFITHGVRFDDRLLDGTALQVSVRFADGDTSVFNAGWGAASSQVFPIFELRLSP